MDLWAIDEYEYVVALTGLASTLKSLVLLAYPIPTSFVQVELGVLSF